MRKNNYSQYSQYNTDTPIFYQDLPDTVGHFSPKDLVSMTFNQTWWCWLMMMVLIIKWSLSWAVIFNSANQMVTIESTPLYIINFQEVLVRVLTRSTWDWDEFVLGVAIKLKYTCYHNIFNGSDLILSF